MSSTNPDEQNDAYPMEFGLRKMPSGLTLAEEGRLKKLAEEAGELIQAINKALLYGWTPFFEGVQYDNRADIEKELGDIRCAAHLLERKGNINHGAQMQRMVQKKPGMIRMIPFEHADDHLLNPAEH